MKRAGAAAAWGAAREIALVPQILARSADMAGDVRTQTNVTVLALVTERPFRIFTGHPGRETLIADASVAKESALGDISERRRLRERREGRRVPQYLRAPRVLHSRATRRPMGRFSLLGGPCREPGSGHLVGGPSPSGC